MSKNLLYAVSLSLGFLTLWYFFGPKMQAPSQGVPPGAAQRAVPGGSAGASAAPSEQKKEEAALPGAAPAKKIREIPETERWLESKGARILIHSRGAAVRHWWLKEDGAAGEDRPDLVEEGAALAVPPLATFPELNFSERPCGGGENGACSAWAADLPSGVRLEKRFLLDSGNGAEEGASHFVSLRLIFSNPTGKTQSVEPFAVGWSGGLGTVESEKKENARTTRVLAYPSPTREVEKFSAGEYKADYAWAGIDNRYYLFAILPGGADFEKMRVQKSKTEAGTIELLSRKFELAPGEKKEIGLKLYAGPKGYTRLKRWGLHLEHAVDFGYFGFLGKWALKAMYFLHGLTGNYGWAIVILTCLLQIIVLPLSLTSYKSMAAMKKLQPRIQELQKRYKEDKVRLNQEMMNLYKDSKTNPFGGCLPMILQIPVFWAFFTMLRNAYELRGAPWIFWIRDLSQHDPYYVLPIVMGGGMFLQQKMSGNVGDPTQAKMMMLMPVVFTFMFLHFPSGLVLYWLTNSILSIATQYWFRVRSENAA